MSESKDEPITALLDRYCIGICVALFILALLFIMFGHIYREQVQLALKHDFVKLPATTFDWWSISHAMLFGIIGFIIPNYHFTFFTIGAFFEIFEDMLSSDKSTQLVDCMNPHNKKSNIMCKFSINDDYWYGKWDDVFVNLFGYVVGSSIRSTCAPCVNSNINQK
jgi:hypothetical protein